MNMGDVASRNASRERTRQAARMIPGFGAYQDGQDALADAERRRQFNSPEAQAQRATQDRARRLAGLQRMHADLMRQGNEADAAEVFGIIQGMQEQELRAQGPGAVVGDMVGRMGAQQTDPRLAQRRNAFAGMGGQ